MIALDDGTDLHARIIPVVGSQLQDTSLPAPRRLTDYQWCRNEDVGLVFWATVNRFCAECAEFDCPVLLAIQAASANHDRLRMDAKEVVIQCACPYVEEYREADGQVPIRRRRVA